MLITPDEISATWHLHVAAKDPRLAEFAERFFRWRLQESPEFGTLFGIHDYDDRLEEYTEPAFQRQVVIKISNFSRSYFIR
jgi:hypothetical protein